MADVIRCPVCGQPNPDDIEICQHCDSSLKATTSELDGVGKVFRPGETPTKKVTAELEKALPAWLRNARKQGQQAEMEEAPEENSEAASLHKSTVPSAKVWNEVNNDVAKEPSPMDLLAGLNAQAESGDDEDEEAPDWLAGLQTDIAPPAETADTDTETDSEEEPPTGVPAINEPITANTQPQPMPDEPLPGTGELPGWLADLQAQSTEGAEPPPKEPLPNLFDNKKPSIPEESPKQILEDSANELPDWLDKLASQNATLENDIETPAQQSAPASTADDLPDWLSSGNIPSEAPAETSAEETESDATNDDIPDWLGDLSAETAETPAETDALPDWLTAESLSEEKDESSPKAADESTPDWLGNLPQENETALKDESAGGLPDWMEAAASADAVSESLSTVEEEVVAESSVAEDVPSWLSNLSKDTQSAEAAVETVDEAVSEPAAEPEADLGEGETAQPSATAFSEIPEDVSAANETPDWLSDLKESVGAASPQENSPALDPQAPPAAEETPAFALSEEAPSSADDVDAIFDMEMPDWLSSLGPDDIKSPASADESAAETSAQMETDALSSAELPSWVQAMRPVASVLPDADDAAEDEEHVIAEKGPLAGLSGILPAGPGISSLVKPRAHAAKLTVSDTQQTGTALLKQMLQAEDEPRPIRQAERTHSVRLLRWIVTAILLITVLPSVIGGTQSAPLASLYAPEIGAMKDEINALPNDAPVLLVFDYEPGLSGELTAAAAPVVDHLMLRGEPLTVLSTSPTGNALAQDFLQKTQADHLDGYPYGEKYINLGYLPGSSSGMLSFAAQPRAAISQQVGGISIWETPMLQNVFTLSDFSALVILTDDAETGRAWIEQTESYRGDAALLMVVSAQAEPIIQPYYRSGQVDGLVSGLSGAAAYEQLNGRPAFGRLYWDAYSIGLLVAEILLAVGAVWGLLASLRTRKPKEDEV